MAKLSPARIIGISTQAWTDKSHYSDYIAECFEHALPGRNPYHGNGTGLPQGRSGQKGKDKSSRKVFDGTLQNDAVKIANRIQYELFPIGHQWASLVPGPFLNAQQKQAASKDLHGLQEVVFAAIQLSNFDLSIAEWLLELVIAGTACMLVTPGDADNPVIYQTVSQSHVAFREGAFGKIDFISRKHLMRHSLIAQTWKDAKVPELPKATAGKDEDPEIGLIDVCYYDASEAIWRYCVIVTSGVKNQENEQILTREYKTNPWIIARWNKAAEEVQGRSLVMQALPDARVLSSVKSYILKHAALAIGGVFLVKNNGVVNANNIRIFPGATIPVQATGGSSGASIAPLPVQGDINLADLIVKDLINSIHQIMMNDGMPAISEGVRTATELIERMKELQQSLGAPFARILKEGIVPMLEATITILAETGVIDLGEDGKLKLNDGKVQVKFTSPLVQGQSIREVEALQNAAALTEAIGGKEAVGLNFKIEDVGAWAAGKLGVVPELVRTDEERSTMQKQAAQVMQQQNAPQGSVGGEGGIPPQNAELPQAA